MTTIVISVLSCLLFVSVVANVLQAAHSRAMIVLNERMRLRWEWASDKNLELLKHYNRMRELCTKVVYKLEVLDGPPDGLPDDFFDDADLQQKLEALKV